MCSVLNNYLNRQNNSDALINEDPNKDLKIIVIIPAYNEPDILETLASIKKCKKPNFPTEVIILINHTYETPEYIKEQNVQTLIEVNNWINEESTIHMKFHCILKGDLQQKHAGAGLARKIAMDEAIHRFASINNDSGIIVSLDADTLVSNNYLSDIQDVFLRKKNLNCSIFNFEHQLPNNIESENKRAIIIYELYLRYFKQALNFTGFPFAFHTIGSCFAVKASTYAKQGGMNRKKAGEDFYFLHKVFPLGNCIELNTVSVFPSSRLSDRVPFGTGPAIRKIIAEGNFLTYQPICFKYLKKLFNNINDLYKADYQTVLLVYKKLDLSLQKFISIDDFESRINEINNNSASLKAFTNRFFKWFDAFKIIKYLNFTHTDISRIPVIEASIEFLSYENTKQIEFNSAFELLDIFRKKER